MSDTDRQAHGLPLPPPHVNCATGLRPSSVKGAISFTLVSADEVPYRFRLTTHMCTHSLYLQSAKEVGAAQGYVPVGSAQAVRDYVAYLRYLDRRAQLSAELTRSSADHRGEVRHSSMAVPTSFATAAPSNRDHLLHEEYRDLGEPHRAFNSRPRQLPQPQAQAQLQQLRITAKVAPDNEWLSPFLWEEALLDDSSFDRNNSGEDCADLEMIAFHDGTGPVGYEVRPLDCDRTYVQHAATLQHWLTVAELRGQDVPAEPGDGEVEGFAEQQVAPATSIGAENLSVTRNDVNMFDNSQHAVEEPIHVHLRRLPSLNEQLSSSSNSSLSSLLSEASLAAYKADAQRHNLSPCEAGVPLLGQAPGYGAQLALDEREGLLFVERALLSHEWRAADPITSMNTFADSEATRDTAAETENTSAGGGQNPERGGASRNNIRGGAAGKNADTNIHNHTTEANRNAKSAPSSFPTSQPLLTGSQQRRLLELIATADFLGTQSLVELCAKYLAAWLMDSTDDEIVQSFLLDPTTTTAKSAPGRERTSPVVSAPTASTTYELTNVTSFQEPWLRRITLTSHICEDVKAVERSGHATPFATSATSTRKEKTTKSAVTASVAADKKRKKIKYRGEPADACAEIKGEVAEGVSAFDAGQCCSLLSGDQRLSVVRQVKRSGSIMVAPY